MGTMACSGSDNGNADSASGSAGHGEEDNDDHGEESNDDHDEEGHDDHDAGRQFLIKTILDLGPEDSPEVVECVVDLIADLSGFGYTEIEDMYLTQSTELDPYLQSERLRKDSGKTVHIIHMRIHMRIHMNAQTIRM